MRRVPNSRGQYESSGPVGRLSPGGDSPRRWPKRRRWYDHIARDGRLTSGVKAWLILLGSRSDDTAKPVWGAQAAMAATLAVSARTVCRYAAEAEAAGYVTVYRTRPERGRDGRWCRRKTNRYYLTLPSAATAALPAPRRRQRSPYCVIASHKPRSHLHDTVVACIPYGVSEPPPTPEVEARGDGPGPRTPEVMASRAAAWKNLRRPRR